MATNTDIRESIRTSQTAFIRRTAAILISAFSILVTTQRLQALDAESAQELKTKRASVTFIDVRDSTSFREAHIPGAINVPAAVCPTKGLPPLGRVVVYGDGLDIAEAMQAAADLDAKTGIEAELLEGGFSRWEALGFATTREPGLKKEEAPMITYEKLHQIAAANPDLVLVDLRRPQRGSELTDLRQEFPQIPAVKSALADADATRSAHSKIYVLIDDLDNRSVHKFTDR